MKTIDVGFLGYGTRALDALFADGRFNVKYFITPKSRLCPEVYECAEKYKDRVSMETVSNKAGLKERLAEINDVSCFVMNACPYILTEEILSHVDVYNIHPGSLYTNRGHHPHLWSVLLNEKETEICLHKVTPEIDLGLVVESVKIPLTGKEDSLQVLNKAEDQIPVLLNGLYDFLTGKRGGRYTAAGGEYRRNLTYSDYEIKKEDSLSDIDRKIRTRAMHSGAFLTVGGKRIYFDKILSSGKSGESFFRMDGGEAVYANGGFVCRLRVKKITGTEGSSV